MSKYGLFSGSNTGKYGPGKTVHTAVFVGKDEKSRRIVELIKSRFFKYKKTFLKRLIIRKRNTKVKFSTFISAIMLQLLGNSFYK